MRRSSPAAEPAVDRATGATDPGVGAEAGAGTATADEAPRAPTPHDLAERGGTFAMTAEVLDPKEDADPAEAPDDRSSGTDDRSAGTDEPGNGGPEWVRDERASHPRPPDDPQAERGLRGLVGGGSSQVSVGAALRARDATRPTEADLTAAEAELVIVRRGWVPREDLPPRTPRH
jgi:hypothetical protein